MFAVPRKQSSGKTKWYLRYWEKGELKNICKKTYPDFWTKKDALKWIKSKKGMKELDFVKRHSDGIKWLKWKNDYAKINDLLEDFKEYHKENAPNSYMSAISYLEKYVIRFYIDIQKENNLKYWCRYHEEFRKFLKEKAFKVGTKTAIAYSTKNHCIRAYNNFMKFLKKKHYIEPHDYVPCESFAEHLVNQNARGYEDIINLKEYGTLCEKLKESKEYFMVLYNSGMRFHELYSLPMSAVYEDNDNFPEFMREKFTSLGKSIYGYILLESQMKYKTIKRKKKTGHIERKPLKGRRAITFKDARIIPIMDMDTWNIIVQNYNRAFDEHKKREFISSKENDYLLFNVNDSRLRRDFLLHCKKGFHACRHSFVTNLVGETRDMIITKAITGHKSDAFFKYLHIYEEIALKAKKGKVGSKRGKLSIVEDVKKAS